MVYGILKKSVKSILRVFGIERVKIKKVISQWSVRMALMEIGFCALVDRLRIIVPDISNQEEGGREVFKDYGELKRRSLQAFQCFLMTEAIKTLSAGELTVVDIGDSAGTHMLYLKELTKGKHAIDTISVNLDPRAIKKIKSGGLKAILCRAEDLDLGGKAVDLFTSFEMVEHLHNPAIFFHNLSKSSSGRKMVVTVPYLRQSRVALQHLKREEREKVFAEDVHVFELSPNDWTLLFLHSGWRVVYSKIYYQYPRKWLLGSWLLSLYWRITDFEGFWGVILEKDNTFSDLYQDW